MRFFILEVDYFYKVSHEQHVREVMQHVKQKECYPVLSFYIFWSAANEQTDKCDQLS